MNLSEEGVERVAKAFLSEYPRYFLHLVSPDVVMLMVQGYVFRSVLFMLDSGVILDRNNADEFRRLCTNVFNAATKS